jgi:two-component system catabolic regulation response regulator CreB
MVIETGGLKVVVADSDRTVLELLQIRLDVAGYHACVARTGPAVLETLKYIRPAAMVIDTDLQELDGFNVLRALGEKSERLPCPTLVVGRRLGPEHIRLAIDLGARDCMTKPFSGADVLERVGRMLRGSGPAVPRRIHYVNA